MVNLRNKIRNLNDLFKVFEAPMFTDMVRALTPFAQGKQVFWGEDPRNGMEYNIYVKKRLGKALIVKDIPKLHLNRIDLYIYDPGAYRLVLPIIKKYEREYNIEVYDLFHRWTRSYFPDALR